MSTLANYRFYTQASDMVGPGAYWRILIEDFYVEPGKTKIVWTMYKGGRTSSPTWLHTFVKLKISADTKYPISNPEVSYLASNIAHSTDENFIYWQSDRLRQGEDKTIIPNCRFNEAESGVAQIQGSFIIQHDINGYAKFKIEPHSWIYYGGGGGGTAWEGSPATNMPYVKSAQPDYIIMTQSVNKLANAQKIYDTKTGVTQGCKVVLPYVPNDDVQNTAWHYEIGYHDGTDNSFLSAFELYGRVGALPDLNNYDFYFYNYTAGTMSTSDLLLLDRDAVRSGISLKDFINNNRGKNIYLGVRALNKGGSAFHSDLKIFNDPITIKRLPGVDIEDTSIRYIPSQEDTCEVAIYASNLLSAELLNYYEKTYLQITDSNGVEKTVQWEDGESPEYDPIFQDMEEGTYSLKVYDGIEFGPESLLTIIKNSRPEVEVTISGTELKSVQKERYKERDIPYIMKPILSLAPSGGQPIYQYTVKLYYKTFTDADTQWSGPFASLNIGNQTSYQIDLSKYLNSVLKTTLASKNLIIGIEVTRNDGIEQYDAQKKEVQITKIPALESFCNGPNLTKIEEMDGYFSNFFGLKFAYDEGYLGQLTVSVLRKVSENSYGLVAPVNSILYPYDGSSAGEPETMYANFNTLSQIPRGAEYYLAYSFRWGDASISTVRLQDLPIFRTYLYTISGTNISWSEKIYNGDPLQIGFALPAHEEKEYGFSASFSKETWNMYLDGNTAAPVDLNEYTKLGDTGTIEVSASELFDVIKSRYFSTTNFPKGRHSYSLLLSATNVFGEATKTYIPITVDFSGSYSIPGWSKESLIFGETNKETTGWNYLLEGMSAKTKDSLLLKAYNDNLTARIYFIQNDRRVFLSEGIELYLVSIGAIPTPSHPVDYKLDLTGVLPGFVTQNDSTIFGIAIYADGEEVYVEEGVADENEANDTQVKYKTARLIPGSFSLTNATYTEKSEDGETNGTIIASYLVTDFGCDEECTIEITADLDQTIVEEEKQFTDVIIKTNREEKGDLEFSGIMQQDYGSLRLKFKVILTAKAGENEYHQSYEATTNQLSVYNIAPTVSYRRNQIGINRRDVASNYQDGIAVLGSYQNQTGMKDRVYFSGVSDTGEPIISYFNVNLRRPSNFVILGGSWSEEDEDVILDVTYLSAEESLF